MARQDAKSRTKLLRFVKSRRFVEDLEIARRTPSLAPLTRNVWILLEILRSKGAIPREYRAHKMNGEWASWWNCHLAGDLVLIWKYETVTLAPGRTEERVALAALGTHAYLGIA